MTVLELIERLQEMPQDLTVVDGCHLPFTDVFVTGVFDGNIWSQTDSETEAVQIW